MGEKSLTTMWVVADIGLVHVEIQDDRAVGRLALEDDALRCVERDPSDEDIVYVGSQGGGVRTSSDAGETWRDLELSEPDVFALAVSPVDGALYAGTEPSKVFKSVNGGRSWTELHALRRLPSQPEWSFPPRPWTSHVRWIAPSPADADVLLVGIELGGVMRTTDGGISWQDHRPEAIKDCHALAWHPRDTERAYEAGGGGAAWSRDGGATWERVDDGRDLDYCWALAVDPGDPDRWFVSASPGPGKAHSDGDARAYIYRWEGNGPWRRLQGGLPQPLSSMPYVMRHAGRRLLAGLRDGRVFASDDGDTWAALRISGASLKGCRSAA